MRDKIHQDIELGDFVLTNKYNHVAIIVGFTASKVRLQYPMLDFFSSRAIADFIEDDNTHDDFPYENLTWVNETRIKSPHTLLILSEQQMTTFLIRKAGGYIGQTNIRIRRLLELKYEIL